MEHRIMAVLIMVLILLIPLWLAERSHRGWFHRWAYRNPYDRTCSVCGRHEVLHGYTFHGPPEWWEVFDDGDMALHSKNSKKESSHV